MPDIKGQKSGSQATQEEILIKTEMLPSYLRQAIEMVYTPYRRREQFVKSMITHGPQQTTITVSEVSPDFKMNLQQRKVR